MMRQRLHRVIFRTQNAADVSSVDVAMLEADVAEADFRLCLLQLVVVAEKIER